jgi:hypothetical protein
LAAPICLVGLEVEDIMVTGTLFACSLLLFVVAAGKTRKPRQIGDTIH